MHRLFVAIRPPEAVRDRLIGLMEGVEGARWQRDDQLHLTLRFIGEVDRHGMADVADALGAVRAQPFCLAMAGVGTFDRKGKVHTLYSGVSRSPALAALAAAVSRRLEMAGFAPEPRAYHPHVTLARFGTPGAGLAAFLQRHADFATQAFAVTHMTLYESVLVRSGAHYEPVVRYALQ